jgi:transcription elongation GreA/GreB family factor
MHPICQQMWTVNFTTSELQRRNEYGRLAAVRKFVDYGGEQGPGFHRACSEEEPLMSVAFRRESDEEHLEPKFELPIPAGPNLVTARGLRLIEERVAELEASMANADDPSTIARLQRDLRYWRTRQVTADLARASPGEKVEFGTEARFTLKGAVRILRIVGDDEAAPGAGLISFNAPLSRAMLGAQVGDLLTFGNVEDAIEILSISVPGE